MRTGSVEDIIKRATWEVTDTGCWHSVSYSGEKSQSPRVHINKKRVKLYRVLYEHFRDIVPEGYVLTRMCKDPLCINPQHYEVFIKENNPRLQCIWEGVISRCYAPQRKEYKNYGGRGIKVCDEWRSFKPFQKWALSHGYRDTLEIDRIDNNGDYTPENCRFVTHGENNRNRRKRTDFNKNGYTAVYKAPSGKFYFKITVDGKFLINHKYYNTPFEAEVAKRKFVNEHSIFYNNE